MKQYEAPTLTVVGTVEELTATTRKYGVHLDRDYTQGMKNPKITYS